jgi:hypothetical protein
MAQKWNLQDIVPPDRNRKRSPGASERTPQRERPQDIPPRTHERRREPVPPPEQPEEVYAPDTALERIEVIDGRLSRFRRAILLAVIAAVLLFIAFTATIFLSGAKVTIKPKIHDTTLNATFEAFMRPSGGDLGYELLTLEEIGERQVAATGQEEVKERAQGKITVYNGASAASQRLIKNTRFESPTGLIYRISDSIEVPGMKKDAAGNMTPGSISVEVFADGTGEAYNMTTGRFSVPGLKRTEQYDKIYAEVGEGGIQGGFEGMRFIIDETELATTKQKLHMELRDKLLSRVAGARPNGFVAFDQAITFTYTSLPASEGNGQSAIIKEQARLYIPIFKEDAFASFIAAQAVPGYDKLPVRIEDPKTLTFTYTDSSASVDLSSTERIKFTLAGPIRIIWNYDAEKLKKDLAGVSEEELPDILPQYPSIDTAQAVIRPIWKNSFPENTEEIEVVEAFTIE